MPQRHKVLTIFALLIAGNVAAWVMAFVVFQGRPELFGIAFLAYSFGLRHAFDPDHIAAIDNVTRKLMHEGRRPIAAGFYFSLGHSTVVVALALVIAATTAALQHHFDVLRTVGGAIGISVSALFLFAIAAANLAVLAQIYRSFQAVKRGAGHDEDDVNHLLSRRGLLGRLLRPLFRLVGRSWHMYPLGVLFAQATQGLSLWSILVFPALFTAGMALMDTADSTLMVSAYGWAFANPLRKLYYNITITFISVVAALVIGGIEALGLIADKLALDGPFWGFIAALRDNFGFLGYGIVVFFVASWLVSYLVYKAKGYDRLKTFA